MGWMTHKKSWSDVPILGAMLLAGSVMYAHSFIWRRVIQGDIHWNESNQDVYDRQGKICTCRKCKNTSGS